MPRQTFPVAVHLFLRQGDCILLLRRFQTGYEDGKYSLIAGHVEPNEDVYAAMRREAAEEAGIAIAADDLEIVQVMHRQSGGESRVDYFLECHRWQNEARNMEPDKCDAFLWTQANALPDNTIGYIAAAVANRREGVAFSLYGWE